VKTPEASKIIRITSIVVTNNDGNWRRITAREEPFLLEKLNATLKQAEREETLWRKDRNKGDNNAT